MFSSYDCAVKGYRQKEDPWNAIIAGFLTGGSLGIRGEFTCSGERAIYSAPVEDVRLAVTELMMLFTAGPRSAFGSAVGCGILLGVFEGEPRLGVANSFLLWATTAPRLLISATPELIRAP